MSRCLPLVSYHNINAHTYVTVSAVVAYVIFDMYQSVCQAQIS